MKKTQQIQKKNYKKTCHSEISKKYTNYLKEIFSLEQEGYKIKSKSLDKEHNRKIFLEHKNGNIIKAVFMFEKGTYSIFKNNKWIKSN